MKRGTIFEQISDAGCMGDARCPSGAVWAFLAVPDACQIPCMQPHHPTMHPEAGPGEPRREIS